MKVLSFGRKQIQKINEKGLLFRGKLASFMSRLSKELLIIFPILFLIIYFLNLFIPKSEFQNAKEDILANRNPAAAHYKLGQLFFAANDYPHALQEFSTESGDLKNLINQPDDIKKQILYWQNLVTQIPSYRDGYIKLFVLNTKIYRDFDAQKFFKKAFDVDPNLSLP